MRQQRKTLPKKVIPIWLNSNARLQWNPFGVLSFALLQNKRIFTLKSSWQYFKIYLLRKPFVFTIQLSYNTIDRYLSIFKNVIMSTHQYFQFDWIQLIKSICWFFIEHMINWRTLIFYWFLLDRSGKIGVHFRSNKIWKPLCTYRQPRVPNQIFTIIISR